MPILHPFELGSDHLADEVSDAHAPHRLFALHMGVVEQFLIRLVVHDDRYSLQLCLPYKSSCPFRYLDCSVQFHNPHSGLHEFSNTCFHDMGTRIPSYLMLRIYSHYMLISFDVRNSLMFYYFTSFI